MFNVIETTNNDTLFIGDIHGEFKAIGNWVKQNNLENCNIVFCGDFGLGFSSVAKERQDLNKPNKICEERNIDCYIVRGNHDDPSYYNTDIPKLNLSRFKPVSDYTVIQTPEHNILCLGGAVSTDRVYRIQQYNTQINDLVINKHYQFNKAKKKAKLYWWKDEPFIFNQNIIEEIHKANINIDVVASHSAPQFCQPIYKPNFSSWSSIDPKLDADLYDERKSFTDTFECLRTKGNSVLWWFYGHYHQHSYEIIEETRFVGLDMGRRTKQGGDVGGYFDMFTYMS